MGSLPPESVVSGARTSVPAAPLIKHMQQMDSDRIALIYSDETCRKQITYAELEAKTNAISRALTAHARPRGANRDNDFVIAVCMQPTHKTIMALLSTWKAGAAYLPIEPSFPQGRISHILKDSEPSLVIYDHTANPSMFSSSGVPSVSFEELALEASVLATHRPTEQEMLIETDAASTAIILYTSGSTGIPKGVRLPYSAICNRLWWQFRTFPFADDEVTCVWKTALTFVDSVCEIWGPLLHGRTLLILSKETTRDPQKLVRVLTEYQVKRLVLVPTLLRSILLYVSLNPSERLLQHLKLWVCSGETLSKELATQFFQSFGDENGYKLANFYGSTEVMGDVTYYVLEQSSQVNMFPSIPIGSPLDNCRVYILDEHRSPAESGEMWVAGRNLAAGYVGVAQDTRFEDNPHAAHPEFARIYRTGDFGYLHKGVILYSGRTDSQVKIRGHRVDLQEVERAVTAVQGIEKGVVLCYGLASGNPEILAFVTIKPDARLSNHHIETALQSALTSYMIPQVIIIDTIPLLVNGKVDRQGLLKMYENTNNNDDAEIPLDIDYSGVSPQDLEAARVLFETVGEVLGRSARGTLSLRANFYELGGNSLNSIYTITRLRDKGYYIEISDFLGAANLREVLSHLNTSPDASDDSEHTKYSIQPMRDEHKDHVIEMIVSSFYEKAELEQFVRDQIAPRDYALCITACWHALRAAALSVVLEDKSGTPIAVALNFDARDEPEIEMGGGLAKIMTFLEYVEGSVRDTMLPEGKGAILHSFMMATDSNLTARENVEAIRLLEFGTEKIARERRFRGIFTTNTSPLTQQLGRDVLGFQTLLDYQINQYIDPNGDRIFGRAPDDMRAIVCWKPVD
ncbi:beta-alanyl-bioamine nonribosomal peptide synthetase ebony [Danaus plexippus]|uniref:beta-alanyl-bioamine nonribosomal peptide synthetase ebony n=1 Tax=Danaus plexippus TaxID=13037 RepID=UPI002AB164C6|nr:beta-alanyl-bioamine nonribosomal peptide synthetase ebony [Danaus plexippus]